MIGTSCKLNFVEDNRKSSIQKLPDIQVITDGQAKATEIEIGIVHRSIFAYGSLDGDIATLPSTTGGDRKGLGLFNHHDDSLREYAYDRGSSVGELDKGLDVARDWG